MGLKIKNINIMGVYQFLGGGGWGHKKTICGEFLKKGDFDNFPGAWQKIRRVFFFFFGGGGWVDTSMHTMT